MGEDSEPDDLHLRVSLGDVTVEVEGPVDVAETWFESLREDYLGGIDSEFVEAAANGGTTPGNGSSSTQFDTDHTPGTSSAKSRSLTEFYRTVDTPTKQDSALIVGWYLEYHQEQDNFTKSEIEEKAKDAKISLGANLSRDISNQVEDGHIERVSERDGQGAFHLTLSGEDYVTDELLNSA